MNFGGPMTLVSKTTTKENESNEEVKEGEEGFILNSDDEVVAYYSNNTVKKFFNKPISGNFKISSEKKPILSTGANQKVVKKVDMKVEEKKTKKTLKGDFGYNFN